MFSGIIEALGTVRENDANLARLVIESALFEAEPPDLGDSIAICGVCLTVAKRQDANLHFDLASETRRVTTIGELTIGASVNLERSLRVGDRIHGHFVHGHVDAVSTVLRIDCESNTWRFECELPEALRQLAVRKGSIAVDGVSLTIGETTAESFSFYVIPHTFSETTFSQLKVGQRVNLEADMLSRYVQGCLTGSLT